MLNLTSRPVTRFPAEPLPTVDGAQWELARRIHRRMLPDRFCDKRVEVAVRYDASEILGGDYCNLLKTDDNKLFVCICDVTGHGLAAALLAAQINSFVMHELTVAIHPCEVMDTLNSFVIEYFADLGMYATFFCAEIDLRWGGITYAGAGHPPALLWHRTGGATERLESLSSVIGAFPKMGDSCPLQKTSIKSGDRLLLFTDGLTETRNCAGEFFGLERIEKVLASLSVEADSDDAIENILAARREFACNETLDDDVLIVASRFL